MANSIGERNEENVELAKKTGSRPVFQPNADILDTADEMLVLLDLPGVKSGEVDIHFENGKLSVHAPAESRQPESAGYLLREYGVGDYHRAFQLGESIDPSGISAEYGDGVLTLHLPKLQSAKPRKVGVKVV